MVRHISCASRLIRHAAWSGALLLALPALSPQALAQNQTQPPARQLFGKMKAPAQLPPQAIGFYSKGCVAGAMELPVTGPHSAANGGGPLWQAMRLSRNRNYGHPELLSFIGDFAEKVPQVSGWSGILVGDMSQPRGGPMLTGHASHQIGLDVDIWLTPGAPRPLSRQESENISATMMVRKDRRDIDPANWRPDHWRVIRAAAQDPRVERVLVNAAIKKALCRDAQGDRSWLAKVRPYWGHDYHMHVRLSCPAGSPQCRPQAAPPQGDGCGSELAWWFSDEVLNPKPKPPPKTPPKPKPQLTLADLPPACAVVLEAQ